MNNNIAIKAEGLGKAYRIGLKEQKSETLIGAVIQTLQSPLKNFRNLTNLKRLESDIVDKDIFWANRNISFEVREGEVLGIIGKNGAGKSTLLKLLSRITEPTEGRIEIYGRVASLLEVGTGFNPDLTGSENIYLNGTILGLTKKEIDARYNDIVEFSGIEQFMETPVKRYSSGMKVRLAFAVAAHLDPEVLIIDEVLAVGDAEFQKKCLGKVQSIANSEGRTVLFVSHDMAAIKNLCTRALLLQKGTIVTDGDPADVVDFYLKNNTAKPETILQIDERKRGGNGKFKTTDITFLNNKMEQVTVLESGMDLNIKICYQCTGKPVNPVINLIIKNNLQFPVVNLLSRIACNGVIQLKEEGFIICHIPKLPLMAGRYSIDLLMKFDFEFTDHVEDIVTIDVEKGDFYGTGKIIESMRDGVLVYHTWQIDE
jgi:lipopolysaccharide transport system ATP-binding protein